MIDPELEIFVSCKLSENMDFCRPHFSLFVEQIGISHDKSFVNVPSS